MLYYNHRKEKGETNVQLKNLKFRLILKSQKKSLEYKQINKQKFT